MNANIIASIAAIAIIGGALYFVIKPDVASTSNVTVTDGKQVVEIIAKGKYTPKLTAAKAALRREAHRSDDVHRGLAGLRRGGVASLLHPSQARSASRSFSSSTV